MLTSEEEAIRTLIRQKTNLRKSHDDLLAACEEAEKVLTNMIIPMGVNKKNTHPNKVLNQVKQAIAKAKELK